jgi:hypothetical protein
MSKRKNVKVYRINSSPLKSNELKDSPGENETFLVESSPSKLLKNLIETIENCKERIESLERENKEQNELIKEQREFIKDLSAKEKARALYERIHTSRLLCIISLVHELEESIHSITKLEAIRLSNKYPEQYRRLVRTTKGKIKERITYYDVLAFESASTHGKLLDTIQRKFSKENEAYGNVDLKTLMPKLQKLRQKRNKLSAHLFEDKSSDLNLEIKIEVLLDIEKAISEGNVASEILEVEGLILIAMNREKDNIEKKNNKTLEQIVEEEKKKDRKRKNPFS